MPQRVILHMGTHKTGTTALQQMFSDQEDRLERSGILYPRTGRALGHHGIANAVMDRDRRTLRALCNEVSKAETVLLSSELFGCLNLEGLTELRRLFPGADFELIVVLRRLPALLPSHWRELIKHGLATPFSDYVSQYRSLAPIELSSPVRPFRLLQDFAAVFGHDSLKLLVFDSRKDGAQYGADFVHDALGLADASHYVTRKMNQMPAYWKIELARIFHCFGIGRINHIGRKAIAHGLLGKLNFEGPRWIDDFREGLEKVEPTILTQNTPFIAEDVQRVLNNFHDRFLDAPEELDAPMQSEVRCFPVTRLPEALDIEMRKEFRHLRERLTDTTPA